MKYILKWYDLELASFDINVDRAYNDVSISGLLFGERKDLLPELVKDEKSLLRWLEHRSIPKNRAFVREILHSQGLDQPTLLDIINISYGLSVNDCYWVVPDTFKGDWDHFNLYDNKFDDVLAMVAFTGNSTRLAGTSPSPEMTTNGTLAKAWRRVNNELYLFKGGRSLLGMTIGKEPYSEFYASQIAERMGLSHYVKYDLEEWHGILASVCKNFCNKDISFIPMSNIDASITGTKDLIEYMNSNGFMNQFKEMILFDAVIMNVDRHYGNFGLLKDNQMNKYIGLAPIFDNGFGLFAGLADSSILDQAKFKEEQQRAEQSFFGLSHKALVQLVCDKDDILKLEKLKDFRFEKHPTYNLSDERLDVLNSFIQNRALELISVIECDKQLDDISNEERAYNISGNLFGYEYNYVASNDMMPGRGEITTPSGSRIEFELTSEELRTATPITLIEGLIESKLKCKSINERLNEAKGVLNNLSVKCSSEKKDKER